MRNNYCFRPQDIKYVKRTAMRVSIIAIFCIGLVVLACNKRAGVNDDCESDCNPNRACTEEFRSLFVQVVNKANNAVQLDSFVFVRLRDNQTIAGSNKPDMIGTTGEVGRYLLFSDSKMNETSRCGEDFEFRGYLNKQSVANSVYKIAHDCCHINLIAGDTKIIIDK